MSNASNALVAVTAFYSEEVARLEREKKQLSETLIKLQNMVEDISASAKKREDEIRTSVSDAFDAHMNMSVVELVGVLAFKYKALSTEYARLQIQLNEQG